MSDKRRNTTDLLDSKQILRGWGMEILILLMISLLGWIAALIDPEDK